jgi:hypothetical protein
LFKDILVVSSSGQFLILLVPFPFLMARYSRFRRVISQRTKRNAERIIRAGSSVVATATQQIAYTYTATQACTIRSIKLDTGVASGSGVAVPYVLVVVREGYNANSINYPAATDDLYNPTMDVLISGVITDSVSEDHKSNSIGRKLKAGDRLALIYRNAGTSENTIVFEMNFTVLT